MQIRMKLAGVQLASCVSALYLFSHVAIAQIPQDFVSKPAIKSQEDHLRGSNRFDDTSALAAELRPTLSTSGLSGSSMAGTDSASCGGVLLTQNFNPDMLAVGTVSCNAGGVNTDNFYARNYPIAEPILVKCVDFGVELNNAVAATNVRVRLYTSPNAGTPVTANLTLIPGSEMQVSIPANANLQFFSATYAGSGIAVPAGNLVVELFTPCRQTTCTPPGDGGGILLGSNSLGQTAPSYIKAPACGVSNYVDTASIGFPNIHIVQRLGTFASDPCQTPLPSCRADVAGPSNGPPDGVVNVSDLLTVINTWGQTQNPPGSGLRPLGDCDPLPNGNCLVNVSDLLIVINAWGSCPMPPRACCLPGGACQLTTQAECTSLGGVWQSLGSTCNSVVCEGLGNDECAGAFFVTNGTHNISNFGATNSAGIPGGGCIFGGPQNISKDIWFKYTASCTGIVQVDLCATTGGVTDTTLQVYSGSCGNLTEVACDDDGCSNNPAGDLSKATFSATMGTQYYVRVGVWGSSPSGAMALHIACASPNNDFCAEARTLAIGEQVSESLATATADNVPTCNGVESTIGRWYTIVSSTDQMLTVDTCLSPNESWDCRINVYCGTNCSDFTCVAGSNANVCGQHEIVDWCAKADQKYWILVHSNSVVAPEGNYTLRLTAGSSCSNSILCGLPGNECTTALGPLVLGPNTVSNVGMTTSVQPICSSMSLDVWYDFTPPVSGLFEFSLCGSSSMDSALALYSGTCGSLVQVACDDEGCGAPSHLSSMIAEITAGDQYKIRFGSWNYTEPGSAVLTIEQVSGCGVCTGTPEGVPCPVDGNDPHLDPNGGCNATPPMFGLPGNVPITVGQVICGTGAYYMTNGAGYRDTDWYLFQAPSSGTYAITACAEFPITVGFVSNGTTNVQTCSAGGTPAFVPGVKNIAAFTEGTATSILNGGTMYAVFVAPQGGLGMLPCGNYRFKVSLTGPPPAPPANDSCANAIAVSHTSTTNGTTAYATPADGPDPEIPVGTPSCHWGGAPSTYHNTVWYKFVATAATARVRTCATTGAAIDTLIGVYAGSCGNFVQIGCGEDECAAGAAPYYSDTAGTGAIPVTGLTIGNTYYISVGLPGGWTGEAPGNFVLTVSN